MAADTISGYIQALLDGTEFKQTAYALDRDSRKASLARFLKRASAAEAEETQGESRLAAWGRRQGRMSLRSCAFAGMNCLSKSEEACKT